MVFPHDNLSEQFRLLRKKIANQEYQKVAEDTKFLVSGIYRLLLVEENNLFPNSLELLTEEDWIGARKGEEEIGWMLPEKPAAFPVEQEYIHPSKDFTQKTCHFPAKKPIIMMKDI